MATGEHQLQVATSLPAGYLSIHEPPGRVSEIELQHFFFASMLKFVIHRDKSWFITNEATSCVGRKHDYYLSLSYFLTRLFSSTMRVNLVCSRP